MLFSSMCLWIILRITFSNSLPIEGRRLTGLRLLGNCGSLPGFCKAKTFPPFQDDGNVIAGFRGRCLRHSFLMPSVPQAFLNLREFVIFCTSQGLTLSG
jgi:hypothetical protein